MDCHRKRVAGSAKPVEMLFTFAGLRRFVRRRLAIRPRSMAGGAWGRLRPPVSASPGLCRHVPSATYSGGAAVLSVRSTRHERKARPLPWPEPNLPIGRRIQLSDGDCALAGLRIVHEMLLAAERSRQIGGPEHDVGPRVMEGLMMACLELGTHAAERVRPQ